MAELKVGQKVTHINVNDTQGTIITTKLVDGKPLHKVKWDKSSSDQTTAGQSQAANESLHPEEDLVPVAISDRPARGGRQQ
jgi:hypothetical protein